MSTALFSRKSENVTFQAHNTRHSSLAYREAPPQDVEVKDVGEQRAILTAVRLAGRKIIKREFGSAPELPLTPQEKAKFEAIERALVEAPLPSFDHPLETAGTFPAYKAAEAAGPIVVQALVELTLQADQDPTKFNLEPSTAKAMLERGVDAPVQEVADSTTYSHAA